MYRFDCFQLSPAERQLRRDGAPVELSGRYLDALSLLVSEPGKLVTKDRFMAEVWRGVPVTDEALTQCVRTLRRVLGDEAARPRFIETVPKHGYRFIAAVEQGGEAGAPASERWSAFGRTALAGTLGGTAAGAIGGLVYGLAAAGEPREAGMGTLSVLLVISVVTAVVALVGAAGVSLGLALGERRLGGRGAGTVVGAALGGLVVGAVVKLLGLDAFTLLVGRSPGAITGAFEGALLGCGVGLGVYLARAASIRRSAALGALTGGGAGLAVGLLGGRLMGGSLALLGTQMPGSRLSLDGFGRMMGEQGFGSTATTVTGTLEGMLFGACIAGALALAERRLDRAPTSWVA
ncbi:transcriptional regulator [Sphingomonas sp. BN140010]|uniref:Transcriptional regulator n=1 Tax=Sphingomonas arvum TaxID=2992113 RepID=A0ABT3JDW9_9SPHN|nr:transcriptional regulator [Sphingomonas sp. BN140010]MCW3796960.1 transcriptional regulator [Sphingomonas sp. BN140010]